jgi:hypothetical protein
MKNTILMMCLIATLAIFASAADAARVNKSGPITFSNFVPCAGETVNLRGDLEAKFTFTKNKKGWTVEGVVSLKKIDGNTTRYRYFDLGQQIQNFRKSLLNNMGSQTFNIDACVNGSPKHTGVLPRIQFKVQQTVTFTFKAPGTVTVTFGNSRVSCGRCVG